MRLSEKLAKADSKTTQLTLRVKTSVAAQLKKDADGSEVSVNELASRLLETALELPSWTDDAIALVELHLREAAKPIRDAALQRLREAARNLGVAAELIDPEGIVGPPSIVALEFLPGVGPILQVKGLLWAPLPGHETIKALEGNYTASISIRSPTSLARFGTEILPSPDELPF